MANDSPSGPDFDPIPLLQQALALHQQGQLAEAERLYRGVLAQIPTNFDALQLLGALQNQRGNYAEAVGLLGAALALQPGHAAAQHNLGIAQLSLKRLDEALASFDKTLALRPSHVGALNNRATTLMLKGQPDQAVATYDRALEFQPDNADIWGNRSTALLAHDRFDEALASADRAVALQPRNPAALYNRANAALALNRLDAALADYNMALGIKPDYVEALINRGIVLQNLHRFADALSSYDQALALDPSNTSIKLNKAICQLTMGDFAAGWGNYEARTGNAPLVQMKNPHSAPRWSGESDLAGKTILVHTEQGMGDTIQFSRYAPLLAARGARVILQVQPLLKSLVQSLGGVEVFAEGETLPAYDLQYPLLSLPKAFATTRASIPARVPYLSASAALRAVWESKLGPRRGLRVGLVWSGGQALRNDRNRSIALSTFAPLLSRDISFFSLQKDVRPGDQAFLANNPITHFGDDLADFAHTAALADLMDVVISVDTAAAHLTGALGKPVWILLPAMGTDWRWMTDRADSPWYPTARLFRQSTPGDWGSVMADVQRALRGL